MSGRAPRIVHIIDELKVGGAQTHLVTMLRELRNRGRAHEVISLFEDGPIGDRLREIGIPVTALDARADFQSWRHHRALLRLTRLLRARSPDLVEAHLTWSRILGFPAARAAGVRKVWGFEQGDVYLTGRHFQAANLAGQWLANGYIVCSEALRAWFTRTHHVRPGALHVFHNCVDVELFRPRTAPAVRASFGLPDGTCIFCAVGTLGRGVNKRVDVTIRALAHARTQGAEAALVIAGDGDQRAELEALARQLGVADFVRFLGMRADTPDIYAAVDALVHAAPWEPFGIIAIEALATGIPIVVPDSGGIPEAVLPGVDGFLYRALDHEGLGERMRHLASDPQRRREMGAAGRDDVVRRFSSRAYCDRLYELYDVPPHRSYRAEAPNAD